MFQEVINAAIEAAAAVTGPDKIEADRFLEFVIGWEGAECWPDEVVQADLQAQYDRMVDMIIATSKVTPAKAKAQTPEQRAVVRANGRYMHTVQGWAMARHAAKVRVATAIMEFV